MVSQQNSPTFWQRTKTGSKAGFDKIYGIVDKLGAPTNRLSNKLGSEAFWPTTLDKESEKAARILKSFCKDGFYQEETTQEVTDGPKSKQRVLKKIPSEVIRNAKGLAIFTTMRTGLWVSGAGGSGILIARQPDGSWSPPSGIMLHTAGLGFLIGVDIYDCVLVINSEKALEAFSKVRCTLGGEVSAVAGPVGIGGVLESEVHKRQSPIFTYLKSRGFYAGVQVDGTIVIERTDENERFYGERLGVSDILAGKARHPPMNDLRMLMETLKSAQGDAVDETLLPTDAAPGDYELADSDNSPHFGIPDPEDDDPYGVHALEKQGLLIREAGSGNRRVDSTQFEFNPSPSSPIFATFSGRRSMDNRSVVSRRSSWRTSTVSSEPRPSMTDMSTQTDLEEPPSPRKSPVSPSALSATNGHMAEIPENASIDDLPKTASQESPSSPVEPADIPLPLTKTVSPSDANDEAHDSAHETTKDDEADEVASVHEVHQAAAPQVVTRARIVQVPKRGPPPQLPPRNPIRNRGKPLIIGATDEDGTVRRSPGSSPTSLTRSGSTSSLESVELNQRLEAIGKKKRESADVVAAKTETQVEAKAEVEADAKTETKAEAEPITQQEPVMPGAFQ